MPALSFPQLVKDVEALITNVKQDELGEERQAQIIRLEELLKSLKTAARPVPNRRLKKEHWQTSLDQSEELAILEEKRYALTAIENDKEEAQARINNLDLEIKELEYKNNALNKLINQEEILNEFPIPHAFTRLIPDEKRSKVLMNELIKIKKEIEVEFSGVFNTMKNIFVQSTAESDKLYAGITAIFSKNKLEVTDENENQFKQAASTYHQLFTRIEGVKNPAPLKKTEPRPLNIAEKAARRLPVDIGVVREAKPGEYENTPQAWKRVSDRTLHFALPLNTVRKQLNPVDTDERYDCVVDEDCDSKSKPILSRPRN